MNYIVYGLDIDALVAAGIACYPFDTERHGILFSDDSVEQLIEHLGRPEYATGPSQWEDVMVMTLGAEGVPYTPPPMPEPVIDGPEVDDQDAINEGGDGSITDYELTRRVVSVPLWNGSTRLRGVFSKILSSVLYPVLDKKLIIMSVPHGHATSLPSATGKFHVFIWSSPEDDNAGSVCSPILGVNVPTRDAPFFISSGRGKALKDDNGRDYAEVFPNALYIHHDVCHAGLPEEIELFRLIVENAALALCEDRPELHAKLVDRFERYKANKAKREFVAFCVSYMSSRKQAAKRDIDRLESDVARMQESIVDTIRTLGIRKAEASGLEKFNPEDKLRSEFNRVKRLPHVKSCDFKRGKLELTTDMLFCQDPRSGVVHRIGEFMINLDPMTSSVTYVNTTQTINGMHAPHVFGDGRPCLGNVESYLPRLIGDFEFCTAANLAIQFVQNVNTADTAGRHINEWPVATSDEVSKLMEDQVCR